MTEISKKQLIANRINAKKGGVKTTEGKQIVRYNATKHGIYSSRNIIPGESARAYNKLAGIVFNDLKPEEVIEEVLVQKVISTLWRQRRLLMTEPRLHNKDMRNIWYQRFGQTFNWPGLEESIMRMHKYETSLDKQMYKALNELKQSKKERASMNQ